MCKEYRTCPQCGATNLQPKDYGGVICPDCSYETGPFDFLKDEIEEKRKPNYKYFDRPDDLYFIDG